MAKSLDLKVTLSAVNKATGPLKKIMQGSRGVGRAMKETREEMRELQDQQKQLSAFRDMSRQSTETRNALRNKREELDRLTSEINNATGPTKRLTQRQEKAREAVARLNTKYRDQRSRVSELSKNLPKAADGVRGFQQHQERLETQIRETTERLERQRQALDRLASADVGGRFRKMTSEIGSFGRRLAGVTAGAGAGLFALAKSTATLGDDVAKTADKLGLGTRQLQELRYAAERSGLSTQTLDTATQRMVRRVSEAAQGSGAAKDAIAELGLSAKALAGMTPDQQLAAFADALQGVESQGDRVRLMMKVFDTEGVAMVNMLRDGSAGLEQYYRDARAVGYALGDDATRGSEAFNDALLDAQSGLKGMRNTIGAELLPAVTELMKDLSGWMRENRDEVQAFARTFGDRLKEAVPVIRDVAKGVGRLATILGNLTNKAADAVGGFDNLAFVVGGLFASKAIFSVLSFAAGVGKAIGALGAFAKTLPIVATGVKALGAAFAATPIGWLVAGIAAVAGAAYLIYQNWDAIGAWFGQRWREVKEAFDDGLAGIGRLFLNWNPVGLMFKAFRGMAERLGMDVPPLFKDLGTFVVDGIILGFSNGWEDLRAAVGNLAGGIVTWFKDKLGIASPSKVFAGFGANLLDGLINGIDEKWQLLKDKIGATAGAVTSWFKDKLGINSPSRVFAEFGVNTMQGYQQGLKAEEAAPLKEVDGFAKRLRQAGAGLAMGAAAMAGPAAASQADAAVHRLEIPRLPALGVEVPRLGNDASQAATFDARPPLQAASGGDVNITIEGGINVHAAPGMDEEALARLVDARIRQALADASRDAAARRRSAFHDID